MEQNNLFNPSKYYISWEEFYQQWRYVVNALVSTKQNNISQKKSIRVKKFYLSGNDRFKYQKIYIIMIR